MRPAKWRNVPTLASQSAHGPFNNRDRGSLTAFDYSLIVSTMESSATAGKSVRKRYYPAVANSVVRVAR
jgi:hypothetical protein